MRARAYVAALVFKCLCEVSMLDTDIWTVIEDVLEEIEKSRRPDATNRRCLGDIHLILFGAAARIVHESSVPTCSESRFDGCLRTALRTDDKHRTSNSCHRHGGRHD